MCLWQCPALDRLGEEAQEDGCHVVEGSFSLILSVLLDGVELQLRASDEVIGVHVGQSSFVKVATNSLTKNRSGKHATRKYDPTHLLSQRRGEHTFGHLIFFIAVCHGLNSVI